jgi:HK97 family phage prohead protease
MSNEAFEYKATSAHGAKSVNGPINLDEAEGIVECFVAGIGNKDSVGDVCASGAFTKSLLRRKPRVVWGHNWNDPIGKVLEIYEVGPQDPRLPLKMKIAGIGGLFAKVQFNLNSEKGKEAFLNVAFFGEEQEWSIGYKTLRAQFDQKAQANILYEVELYEVSPVLHGANQLTGTISVKADDSAYGTPIAMMPQRDESNGYEEMEKELSNLFGAKVSVHSIDGDEVVFTRHEMSGAKKYKCGFMRSQGRYMFGTPEVISIPQSPVRTPQSAPMPMVSGRPMPANEPQRVIRPQQMPSIPVAVKPSGDGLTMIPLPAVQYDSNAKPSLDKEEADLRDALLKIVSRHGKFNEDSNGVWAGYSPAEENEVARIGVKCSNCVFYQGGSKCKIIDMPVEPEGKCRFAVIPNGIVLSSGSKELEEHVSEAENAIIDVLELKYPGEFVLGIVRNAVGKKKKKRNKYKNLAEFGDDDDMGEKSYVIPVEPSFAFRVKTALDPIFDYHRAETFVDSEGIVITSGVTENLIDAVDTALHNLKKKFPEHEIEGKALGYRIGRSLGSRAIDIPNIGGGKRRGRGFGMPEGDLDPRTRVDKNTNGTLFDNIPGWEQPDPTPNGPGSINNPKLSSSQRRDVANIPGEGGKAKPGKTITSREPKYEADDVSDILDGDAKPVKKAAKKAVAKKAPAKKEKVKRGELDFSKKPKIDKEKTPSLSSGEQEKRLTRHSGDPKFESLVSPEELEKRKKFEEVIKDWKDSGYGWTDVPRYKPDAYRSPDHLRGREMGVNQAGVMWLGDDTNRRPAKFSDKNTSSVDYRDWYSGMVMRAGTFLEASRGDDNEFYNGMEDAIHEFMYNNRPDATGFRGIGPDGKDGLSDWMRQYGFDSLSPVPLRKKKEAKKRSSLSLSSGADDDTKPNFDEENYESDTNVDFYDTLLDMMGPEEERPKVTSRKKPKDMSDEEIYRKRMTTGASLQDVAEELGLTRMEVRKREQRHMRKMRKEKDGVSLSSGASDDWATSRGYEPDRFDLRETMNQIGRGNIMAISGGRVERRGNEMILPSTKDQQVVIGYNSVPDLYYVRAEQKINTGKDKGTNRILAQWDEVYADEIGELAYQASLKPANLNSENKEYWKLGKGNQFADRLVDRRSGKLVSRDSRNLPSKPATEESPSLSSGSRGRDYYNYDITTTDEGNGLLDQVHDYLEENPLIKDDITTDIADMLGGDGIVEANGFDTKKAFDLVTGGDDEFQDYMDIVDDAMDALNNGSLAKHKATVRDTNVRLESAKPGSNEAGKLEAIRDRSYEWIGDINKYSRVSTIKDKKNIEASDVATIMISKEQDSLWNARSAITEKYIEDIASAGKESKRRVPIEKMESDTNKVPEYSLALSSGSVMKDGPLSKTLASKKDGVTLSSGELQATYNEIGKSILEALIEMDKNPNQTYWDVPWRTPTLYARNPTRKNRIYQGMNQILLAHTHRKNNYRGNFWAGKSQWAKFGGTPKKGEKPVSVLVPLEGSIPRDYKIEEVFNLDQMEGMPEAYVTKLLDVGKERLDPALKIKDAETLIDEIKPVVKFGGDEAFFSPSGDHIQMPPFEMFKSPEQYYGTLMHELTHWTGGASRINRKTIKDYAKNKKIRASEELIAEMGSSFLLAALGISPQVRTDHVVYIKGWISNLKDDPGAFIKALKEAQTAADYILDRSPTLRRLSGIPEEQRKAKPPTTIIRPAKEIVEESASLSSGGLAEPWQLRDDVRYFGDESQYGSGVISRDSKGRVRDASGGLSLSSGASRVKNLKTREEVPALLEDDESYAEKFLGEKDFEPTQQQKAAIDTAMHMVDKKKGSLVIGAGAGSGKTSTMKQIAKVLNKIIPDGKIYYTVFNAGNAKDGNKTMPRNTGVATTNRIAYWSLLLGGDTGIYGQGTTKKMQLSATKKFAKKLKGAQVDKVITATMFDGSEKQFIGREPGWSDLGYIAPDSIEGVQNILLQLEEEGKLPSTVSIDDQSSKQLHRALKHYAITDMDSPTAFHFGPTVSEYAAALLADPNFEFNESAVDKDMVKTLNLIWEKLIDPKSNVVPTRDYQIKMWALTRPDLRTDPGLIGHRPEVDKVERVSVGTDLDIVSGKLAIGKTVTGILDKQEVTGVILSLQKSTRRSSDGTYKVTAKLSVSNSDNDRPFDIFMFDEAQDMNDVMAKVLTDNALNMPIIMVGDSRQAIYAFRGSIDGLSKQDATYRIPLTQSFRYGSNIQHLANIVLMRENLSDVEWHDLMVAQGIDPGFTPVYHHVKGSAQDVVRETLKITDDNGKRLPKKELNKKLSFIEKTLTLDNSAVSFGGLSSTEVDELLDELRAEHVESAMGEIVENMTNPDAIINSTNRGVYEESMGVIRRGIENHQMAYLELVMQLDGASKQNLPRIYREISEKYKLNGKSVNLLDENLTDDERNTIIEELIEEHAPGGEEGMAPAIGIPADTHQKMVDFYTQLDWIENNKDTFGKDGRPSVSEKLQGIWDKVGGVEPSPEEIRRRLARKVADDPETGTLYRLAHPTRVDPAQQIGARGMLAYLKPDGQSYTATNGEVKRYQALKPIREGLSIPAMEVTGDNITVEKLLAHAKLPPKAVSRGRQSKMGHIIQPQSESIQQGEVFLKLQLDDNDNWTGAVMVGGVGAHGGKYEYRSWMNGLLPGGGRGGPVGWGTIRTATNTQNVQPNYHTDIEKAVKKLKKKYPNATISFEMEQQQADGKSSQFPVGTDVDAPVTLDNRNNPSLDTPRIKFPAWIVKGRDDEETAQIVNELGDMVRESAKGGDTDVDVMTTHISKGREYANVQAGEDFSDPDTMVPVLSEEQREKISKLPNGLKIIRALEINRRQEENKVYILLTRAMRRLDPGRAISKYYFSDTKEDGTPNTRTINSKAAIKNDVIVDGKKIYEDLQIPEGFRAPYERSPEQAEIDAREREAVEKKLDESMIAFTKKMKERLDAEEAEAKRKAEERKKSGKKDGPIAEDEEDEDDSDEPDFSDSGVDPNISALAFDSSGGPIISLSSGAKKKTNRANRRLPFNEQDRQNVADRNILRSKKVPKKRKPAPSAEEFDDLALASGANTPEGRYARRLRAISLSSGSDDIGAGAKTQRVSGKKFVRNINGPRDLAAIRIDGDPNRNDKAKRKLEYAMKFWRGVRERGIALDPEDTTAERKNIEIKNVINSVSNGMAARPKVKIGKVSSNQIKDEVNPDEWFVPVSKLRDAVRIPTEFSSYPLDPDNPNSRMIARWTQTRPLSNEELGKMLALRKSDIAKLSDDDAGITHDAVRFLLSEIGKQDGFDAWRLFAPTSEKEEGVSEMTPSEKFVENLGRANMRDRFIIETFGKDAFPYWIDKEENGVISQKEYASLGEVSETGKFRSTGIFSKKRGESEFGSMAEEMLLEEAVFGGDDTPSDLVKQSVVEAASAPSDKTSREQFDVDQLLESLGIDKSDKWHEELKKRMVESFGVDDVGLNTREIARNWEAGGVPTTYINEMIRTGMIPDAKSVWKKDESGKKLDQELAASKHSVYEALYEFTQSKHAADKAKNTRRNRDYILNSSDFTVSHKGVAARKGATFSKKTGDERRFSQGELQNVVNRFNEIFGTNYKIDDIFSAEQLRNATKRLREEGRTLYGDDASELGKRVILKKDKDKK